MFIKDYKGLLLVNMDKVEVIRRATRNPKSQEDTTYLLYAYFANDYEGAVLYETRHEVVINRVLEKIEAAIKAGHISLLDLQAARNEWLKNEELI